MHNETVYVGLDVGAHKTSFVSSLGQRAVLGSAVGWSKSPLAPTEEGHSILFGEQAISQESALQLVKPFANEFVVSSEASISERNLRESRHPHQAARLLIEQGVGQVLSAPSFPVYAALSVPASATQAFQMAMLEACSEMFAATLLVPSPLAMAYGLQQFDGTLVVDIGEQVTSIYAMPEACLQDENPAPFPLGGRTLEERFIQLVKDTHPDAEMNHAIARDVKERFGYQGDHRRRVVIPLNSKTGRREYDLTDPLNSACQSFAESLVDGVLRQGTTEGALAPHISSSHLLLAGGGSRLRGIDALVECAFSDRCPMQVSLVQDGVFAAAAGALRMAMDAPHDCWSALHQLDRDCFAA